jgi:DinB family protein
MYANVVARVRHTPARLEDLIRGLSAERLTHRDGNKWSIQEQAGHLLDLEELGMNRLDDFEAGRAALTAADMSNQKTHAASHNANSQGVSPRENGFRRAVGFLQRGIHRAHRFASALETEDSRHRPHLFHCRA